ncbi:YlxR family protein [Vulgatibacter incomptus]|uniref:YlxR domain-containing protein n=1 Tax=Vulgatibacter incomptus TaxID=1391653 RepID=A0A0K1P911_9BACT|nr:hypothetical protein AKJ08_0405 [Vulgatibacter incomptus]
MGCGSRGPKEELLRIVCGPEGDVHVDALMRAQGRGAYVHRTKECLEKAQGPRALGRAFRGRARRPAEGALLDEALAVAGRLEDEEAGRGGG